MSKNPETIALHGGDYRSDPATTAVAVPLYRTTSYQFNDTGHAANLFALKEFGNIYTRIMNPTNDVLEKRVAALEGGLAALTVGSGQAASTFAIMNVCQSGDNFISSTDLYGGTVNLFTHTLKKLGIECRYADPADPKNFEKLIDEKTRCFYAETLPNPYLRVFPIKEVSDIGRKHNIPLIMDNTAAPVICKPIEHGAAVVVYSLTKYIAGHGTVVGGALVDGGNFDWTADAKRQPLFNEPDASYGGVVWGKAVPELTGANVSFAVRARVTLLRDLGSALSPDNAFGVIQGLETVALRMKQHCENAEKVVKLSDGYLRYPPESNHIKGAEVKINWLEKIPNDSNGHVERQIKVFDYEMDDTLDEILMKYETEGLTHIIIDQNQNRPSFFVDVFHNEEKYPFLIKEYDSKDDNLIYKVKIFKIDYDIFKILKN